MSHMVGIEGSDKDLTASIYYPGKYTKMCALHAGWLYVASVRMQWGSEST